MKKIVYIFLLIFLFQSVAYCQKETSWWYFGLKSGLNFNSLSNATASNGTVVPNMPKPIAGVLSTYEGCFTVSTFDGKLLFSSDGIRVYDKNNNQMPNGTGLLGDPSATQSGIVIPRPGSVTQYYIVTVPAQEGTPTNGIRYSIVDLEQRAGLGDVTSKNIVLKSGVTHENIAAVLNSNQQSYWLLHRTGQTFYVWAVTAAGISTTPHQTLTSTAVSGVNYVGELIVSPDYTKIAWCNWGGKQVISADFNPATGNLSNIKAQTLPIITYGGAFSPNSEYLYIASGYNTPQVYVNTWAKLRAGTAFSFLMYGPSNLRAGIDGRLYGIQSPQSGVSSKHLYVIMNPNAGGASNFYFPNYLINPAYLGLPAFATGFIRVTPHSKAFACAANKRTYGVEVDLSGGNAPTQLKWNFGDGTPVVTQTVIPLQSLYYQPHTYSSAGTYTITVTPYKGDGSAILPVTMSTVVTYCSLRSNRMTRSDLLNSKQQQ